MADEVVFVFRTESEAGPEGAEATGAGTSSPTNPPKESASTKRREDADAAAGGAGSKVSDKQGEVDRNRKGAPAIQELAIQAGTAKLGKAAAPARALAGVGPGAAAIGPAAAGLAAVGAVVGAGVGVAAAQRSTAERIAALSPDIARARAANEVEAVRQNLRLARTLGPQLAESEAASGSLSREFSELIAQISGSGLGTEVTAIKELMAKTLGGIADIVGWINGVNLPPGLFDSINNAVDKVTGVDPLADAAKIPILAPFQHLIPAIFPEETRPTFGGSPDPRATDLPFTTRLP